MRRILTLRVDEGLVEITAQEWIRQVPEVLLEQGGDVVWTLVGADFRLAAAVPVFP